MRAERSLHFHPPLFAAFGRFVLHAKALPGNPYDGHTLAAVIEGTEKLTGCEVERAYVDKGYRGHETANPRRAFISGQKRGIFGAIKRELRRRSAIEAVIGHMKNDGHLGRCYLRGETAMLSTPSSPPSATISACSSPWLSALLRLILIVIRRSVPDPISATTD